MLAQMSPLRNEFDKPNETDKEMNMMKKEDVGVNDQAQALIYLSSVP